MLYKIVGVLTIIVFGTLLMLFLQSTSAMQVCLDSSPLIVNAIPAELKEEISEDHLACLAHKEVVMEINRCYQRVEMRHYMPYTLVEALLSFQDPNFLTWELLKTDHNNKCDDFPTTLVKD